MFKFLAFIIVLVSANVAFWYFGGPAWVATYFSVETSQPADPLLLDVFIYTLEEEVVDKLGRPEAGFEPSQFLAVFPGLAATDFEGVEASVGYYTIKEGQLVHELGDASLIPTEAGAISRKGMEKLLANASARLAIDLARDGTITDLMRALVSPQ
jgi:hypothetical protein